MNKILALLLMGVTSCLSVIADDSVTSEEKVANTRPNFVFITSDDQSWAHTSKAGYKFVSTPNFDRLAKEGVYFSHAYVTAPTCTASRASVLTGRPMWKTESAALISGTWPKGMLTYQDLLQDAGYYTGQTGKGWGPGSYIQVRKDNPAGHSFNDVFKPDYLAHPEWTVWDLNANLKIFLDSVPQGKPFSLWIGSFEPHRPFVAPNTARFDGADPKDFIPGIMPDVPAIRDNLSSYLIEIERFDEDLGNLIATLKEKGMLDNTIVVVTSDNGMDLPGAKTQNYEYGVRVPLLIRWEKGIQHTGRDVDDMVSWIDMAPTFLDYAGVQVPKEMRGKSLRNILESDKTGQVDESRTAVFSGYERHSGWRKKPDEQTYPRRAIHTQKYAYIRNYFPNRWPVGDPPLFAEATQDWLRDPKTGTYAEPFYTRLTAKRPKEELYDLEKDPFEFKNVAADKEYKKIKKELSKALDQELESSGDPVYKTGKDYFAQFVTPDMIETGWPKEKGK